MPDTRPHVLLAFPYDRVVTGPFVQSLCKSLTDPELRVTPYISSSTVIHLARHWMIEAALSDKSVDFLVMVDSDQVWGSLVLRRLISWNVPVVSPVIVQRNGDPIPVAYREVGQDEQGFWRYDPMTAPIGAYLACFSEEWWHNQAGTAVLPIQRDFEHPQWVREVPQAILDGLDNPLYAVDAVGCGMPCIRRDVLETLSRDEHGLFVSFATGGEDFSLSRNIRAAGWGGCEPGPRGPGIFVDRGCLVGHLTWYSRGADDLKEWMLRLGDDDAARAAQLANLPPANPELVNLLKADAGAGNGRLAEAPWRAIRLLGDVPPAVR